MSTPLLFKLTGNSGQLTLKETYLSLNIHNVLRVYLPCHTLESISSTQIEGNNNNIAEYIETKIDQPKSAPPNIKGIQNVEETMFFIKDNISSTSISRIIISEIHKNDY